MRIIPLFLVACTVLGTAATQDRTVVPENAGTRRAFSPAILSGDFLHMSGTMGTDPATGRLAEGIEAQVRQTFANLETLLDAAGMDFSRVVRVNVFLTDTRHFAAMNQVYRSYFPEAPPTRATVATDLALPGALVEIEMVAARPGVERRVIEPEGVATPELPYSWGIQAGNTLFVAGATSRNPETYQPVTGDIATQTRQVLENIGAVLRAADLDYSDVTECSVFLGDARDFGGMNQVYRSFFSAAPPARATVRAQLMNPAFKVEIQCTAVRGERRVVIPEGVRPSATLSPAIATEHRLYLSGFTGRGPDGYAPGDVRAQTRQALSRLEATLAADGLNFSHVISARIYLTDIRSFGAVNEIYMATVPGPRPARSTVGTALMSADALVEIQMTAVR